MPTDFLNSLLAPDVQQDGDAVSPRRKVLNFTNATVTDNPATRATDISFPSQATRWTEVRLATASALPANTRTSNTLTASGNGALSIDGVAVDNDEIVLIRSEADAENNGPYSVVQKGTAGTPFILTRHESYDASADFAQGQRFRAEEGNSFTGREFVLATEGSITLNTTELEYVEISVEMLPTPVDPTDDGKLLFADSGGYILSSGPTATGQIPRWTGSTWAPGAVNLADTDAVTGLLPLANVTPGSAGNELRTIAGVPAWAAPAGPLTNECHVDPSFVTAYTRDGSKERPFDTIANAIAGTSGGQRYMLQSAVVGPVTIPSGRVTQLFGAGASRPALGALTCTTAGTGTSIRTDFATPTDVTITGGSAAHGCNLACYDFASIGTITLTTTDGQLFLAPRQTASTPSVAAIAWRGIAYIQNVNVVGTTVVVNASAAGTPSPGTLRGISCTFGGNITAGNAHLTDCNIAAVTTITGDASLDLSTLSTNPSVTVTGSLTIRVPNLAAVRTALGLAIGTNVQAYDAQLAALSALGAANTVARVNSGATDVEYAKIVAANIDASAAIALTQLATQAENTVLANATGSTAVPTAVAMAASRFGARASTGNWEAKPITDLAIAQVAGPLASAYDEAISNSASSANKDYSIAASTTQTITIHVVTEDTTPTRRWSVWRAHVVRSGSGTATTGGAARVDGADDAGIAVTVSISGTNTVRTVVANTTGSNVRANTEVNLANQVVTVEFS